MKCTPLSFENQTEKDIDIKEKEDFGNEIFESKDEMKKYLTRLFYGDLYIIGRIWIEAMKKALFGVNMSILPEVMAAPPSKSSPKPPDKQKSSSGKPPPMKYTELPLYDCPHYEYNRKKEEITKCPLHKKRILHEYLYPYVRDTRKDVEQSANEVKDIICSNIKEVKSTVTDYEKEAKTYLRDPENVGVRRVIVAIGAATGLAVSLGKGLGSRIICTGFGTIAAGFMTFPNETDEAVRNIAYYTAKMFAITCRYFHEDECYTFTERLPCRGSIPAPNNEKLKGCCPVEKKK